MGLPEREKARHAGNDVHYALKRKSWGGDMPEAARDWQTAPYLEVESPLGTA